MNDRIKQVLPNLLTAASTLFALAAILVALQTHQKTFVYFLLLSSVTDSLDGALARRLKVESLFGNVYDSLSDYLSYGLAPALCLWFLGYLHPMVAALYVLCIHFRLARFSSRPKSPTPEMFYNGLSSSDAVYIGTLIGLLTKSFNLGFSIVACLAVYPGKLMTKKYKVVRLTIAALTMLWFIYRG